MGQPGDHRAEGLVKAGRFPGKGPDGLPGSPQALAPINMELIPGPHVRGVGAGQLVVRALHIGGGRLHPGAVDAAAVDPAGNVLRYLYPFMAGQRAILYRLYPVNVHAVGIPVGVVHTT